MLLMITLFWGASYYLTSVSLESVGIFTLNAYRFIIAFFLAVLIFFRRIRSVSKETLKYSIALGTVLSAVYVAANLGVKYTSLSNAGFLSSLAVIFTPIMVFIITKKTPEPKLAISIVLCTIGVALLTLSEQLRPSPGDLFCILCAICYALHITLTELIVKKDSVDAFHIGVFQLGFAGLLNLIFSIIIEGPSLPDTVPSAAAILILSIFCTGIAFIVQSTAQQYTSASHVGVILTLEPVFAAIVAFAFAGEILLPRAYFGAFLMIASIVIMEINFTGKKNGAAEIKQEIDNKLEN